MHVQRLFSSRIPLGFLAIALTICVLPASAADQKSTDGPGNCRRCHASKLPLPEKHPEVKGESIAECATCHQPKAGQAQPHPVAARMHRAHIRIGLDCTTCHLYVPGKRFAVIGRYGNLGRFDADQYQMVRNAMESWVKSPWLAAAHGAKQNLSCGACHQTRLIPDDNETILNNQCVACHGSYDKLAPRTSAKLKNPNINPHGSHLGPEISCTVCHHGHRESKPYCLNCHTNFDMPMPGGAAKAVTGTGK